MKAEDEAFGVSTLSELDDLITFENENTRLDFKAVQYSRSMHDALVKDIMSMANAHISSDRYIVVGVKHRPDGSKEYRGIDKDAFVDGATYDQLLKENVEPEIHFEYTPYNFDNILLGIFRIYGCDNRPYMMRKDFNVGLKKGDAWIRKGSHQMRVTREDIDRILNERNEQGFTGVLRIGFDSPGAPTEITRPAIGDHVLPSDAAAERIRSILAERANSESSSMMQVAIEAGLFPRSILSGPAPYETRKTEELNQNLAKVKGTYREADLHELYETHGSKINLVIANEGEIYVEDASIRLQIPKMDGLRIAPKVYPLPQYQSPFSYAVLPNVFLGRGYPKVSNRKGCVDVTASVGELRHGLEKRAFKEPLRVVFARELIGKTVSLECALFGKQLRKPRTEILVINVVDPIVD